MPATAAKTGFGTTFGIESATPGTYTALGEVVNVTAPGLTRDTVEASHHGSTGRIREHIGGMRDSSEASVELNYVAGGSAWDALKAAYDLDTPVNYKVTFPNSETVIFPALITELSPATPINDRMMLTAKFKVSGAPTWS